MRIEPDLSGTAVVLLGSFNPKIFQPFWLASHGLIPAAAAESADISVVHPEITAFSIEDQFSLSVERGRLSMDRNVAPFIVIADLLGRIFGDLLPHTPITRIGINRMVHFRARDEEHRERIGQLVAPREPWGDWGRRTSSGSGDRHGGLLSLTLVERDLNDRPRGLFQVKIEPSNKIGLSTRTGIYMETNDHYEVVGEAPDDEKSREILAFLQERFDDSIRKSEAIIDHIMSLAT